MNKFVLKIYMKKKILLVEYEFIWYIYVLDEFMFS